MRRALLVVIAFTLVATACGDSDGDLTNDAILTQQSDGESESDNTSTEPGAAPDSGDSSPTDQADSGDGNDDGPDNDDAAEIVGNPDLDLDDLPPDVAEALDNIDDVVSIGDCRSEFIGLEMSFVPDGWKCRVLDGPMAGLDGFTLFMDNNRGGIEISITSPSPFGLPCEALSMCDDVEEIDLGTTFDVSVLDVGVPFIYGTHKTVEAEMTVVIFSALSDADIAFITEVLNGVIVL